MDLSPPVLFSALFIGLIGMGLLMYGKRAERPLFFVAGLVLCVFPYFVSSVLAMWGITAATLGGLYIAPRVGL